MAVAAEGEELSLEVLQSRYADDDDLDDGDGGDDASGSDSVDEEVAALFAAEGADAATAAALRRIDAAVAVGGCGQPRLTSPRGGQAVGASVPGGAKAEAAACAAGGPAENGFAASGSAHPADDESADDYYDSDEDVTAALEWADFRDGAWHAA
eukprot:355524-Chlamydomonas_euryale.AAC.33